MIRSVPPTSGRGSTGVEEGHRLRQGRRLFVGECPHLPRVLVRRTGRPRPEAPGVAARTKKYDARRSAPRMPRAVRRASVSTSGTLSDGEQLVEQKVVLESGAGTGARTGSSRSRWGRSRSPGRRRDRPRSPRRRSSSPASHRRTSRRRGRVTVRPLGALRALLQEGPLRARTTRPSSSTTVVRSTRGARPVDGLDLAHALPWLMRHRGTSRSDHGSGRPRHGMDEDPPPPSAARAWRRRPSGSVRPATAR